MKGHAQSVKCERPKSSPNIERGAAGDAWAKINEVFNKRKDLFTRRRNARRVLTLIELVQDNVM